LADYDKYVSFYRFHILDPIYFHSSYWYQNNIGMKLPNIPGFDDRMKGLEVEEDNTTAGFIAMDV
jgi:hypothetical protein